MASNRATDTDPPILMAQILANRGAAAEAAIARNEHATPNSIEPCWRTIEPVQIAAEK